MKRAQRYRIYPTYSQITKIENILSMCRYLYNWCLQERIESYKSDKKTINYYDQQSNLPQLKKERPWFKSVHSQVLQHVLKRLDTAYKNFFRKKIGFPKYKKKGQLTSICYTQFRTLPKDGKVEIPKIGSIKIRYHKQIPSYAKIKTLTLIKEGGKWFVSFSLDLSEKEEIKLKTKRTLGIDLGLNNFVYRSDGQKKEIVETLKLSLKKIDKLHNKLSKVKKRSSRYKKLLFALQKAYYRYKCKKEGFHHKLIDEILKKYDIIFYEDLEVINMTKRPKPIKDETGKYLENGATLKSKLNRCINIASWSSFIQKLKTKAENKGKQAIAVDPKGTTQRCSNCQTKVAKTLKDRMHNCPNCNLRIERDYNSALEILRLGMESLRTNPLEAPTKFLI